MKRVFDIILSSVLLILLSPLLLLICLIVKFTSRGPIFYSSVRIGLNDKPFNMPKFRTMKLNTPELATHLLQNAENFLTRPGSALRRTSLDEIPQLFSILKGDMSLVGPRPALYNQKDLIALRRQKGVHKIKPGLTGLAQINGRDDLSIALKVKFDAEYVNKASIGLDIKILISTFLKIFNKKDISH